MAKTPQYEVIEDDLAAGRALPRLKVKVFGLLRERGTVTREELVDRVFGTLPGANLTNSTLDRKIRKAIESLRDDGVLVLSSAGRAGYSLPETADPDAINEMIAEWSSMAEKLRRRIKMARRHLPKETKGKKNMVNGQMRLL